MADMTPADMSTDPDTTASLGELLARISTDVSDLVRAEVDLARRELSSSAKAGGIAAGVFGAVGVLLLGAVLIASVGGAEFIHRAGIALGWSFLIVAGGYLLVGALLALVGRLAVKRVAPPRRTIVTVRDGVAAARSLRSHSD
jgi:hypothetical protein